MKSSSRHSNDKGLDSLFYESYDETSSAGKTPAAATVSAKADE